MDSVSSGLCSDLMNSRAIFALSTSKRLSGDSRSGVLAHPMSWRMEPMTTASRFRLGLLVNSGSFLAISIAQYAERMAWL